MLQGCEKPKEQRHYIITPFVERNMLNLVRATSTRKFPILVQGPTSAGKPSMIEYLAKFSGNKFVRMDGVKEQRLDKQTTFHSVTTGQVIQGIEIPPGGLQQDMLDSQATICASDVFLAPGNRDDDIQHQVGID